MSTVPKMICVDFDGTICNFAYPNEGEPMTGVKEALEKFRELGYKIHIFSCRTSHWYMDIFCTDEEEAKKPTLERASVKRMVAYLEKYGIPFDSVDDGSMGKPLADFYIDDKGVRFNNNWPAIAAAVEMADKFPRFKMEQNLYMRYSNA